MSDLRRFFVPEITDELVIDGEEFRHAVSVLRIKENEQIIVCDNSGYEYIGTVNVINKKDMLVSITEKRASDTEAKNSVTLIAGYLKGDKTELVVQKAVELGVKNIVVFDSEFSSAYMNANKLERLNKVSKEAAKQCLRATAPEVVYFDSFDKALISAEGYENKLFACEFATESKCDVANLQGSVAIVIGSEGGFSREEEQLANGKGFASVTLGKRILRAETAAVALTSVVMFSLGELGERECKNSK